MSKLAPIITREPVLFFGAILATFEATLPNAAPVVKVAAAAWATYLQRMFSIPTSKADQRVEEAKYVGAVEHQAMTAAGQAIKSRPLRAKP